MNEAEKKQKKLKRNKKRKEKEIRKKLKIKEVICSQSRPIFRLVDHIMQELVKTGKFS